jgi:SpoVK/Ycf46/Vps4 family AAA+-type ATPase
VLFVETGETWPTPQGSDSFDVNKPTQLEQRDVWLRTLGEGHDDEATALAAQFNLGVTAIARVVAAATADDPEQPLWNRVRARARQQTQLRIDALAQRIDTKATWDDIVLPAAEATLLRQIAAHVDGRGRVYDEWGFRERMNRGLGISALFAGASGTGKTMAAEVIANELGQSLHRIDLSSVVSKWVGETEKNLQQLFDAADDANGILFFDEADALFGKRTEVQQSQDRFANIEINFLLQRLESYRGLAILATNMKSALDPAFLRRLRFIVNFPFPGPDERKAIWARAFPERTPREELDLDRLAKLALTGGSVHNVALSAAFLAAKRETPVTMPILFEAARTEMRKIEKPVQEADFKWTEKVVEVAR